MVFNFFKRSDKSATDWPKGRKLFFLVKTSNCVWKDHHDEIKVPGPVVN